MNPMRFPLSCSKFKPTDYDIGPVATLFRDQFESSNMSPLQLIANSSDIMYIDNNCDNQSFVLIHSFKVTVLNDFNASVTDNSAEFLTMAKNLLLNMLNFSQSQFINLKTNRIAYPGLFNGKFTPELFSNVIQLTLVTFSITNDSQAVLNYSYGAQSFDWNASRLYIPSQNSSGVTRVNLQIRTVSMEILSSREMLVGDSGSAYFEYFKLQLSYVIGIPTGLFLDYRTEPSKVKFLAYHVNVSNYFNGSLIEINAPIDAFYKKLAFNKMKLKDATEFPVHIVPFNLQHKFIVISKYDETYLFNGSLIAGFTTLLICVIHAEIRYGMRLWKKRWYANAGAVFPSQRVQAPLMTDRLIQNANVAGEILAFDNRLADFFISQHSLDNQMEIGAVIQLINTATGILNKIAEQRCVQMQRELNKSLISSDDNPCQA